MKNLLKTVTIFSFFAIISIASTSCKKETTNKFLGTYVGTYNNGAGTTNSTYSFVFSSDTEMEVYDGDVATGNKAIGKYTKTGLSIKGFYMYDATSEDTVHIEATMPSENTYILKGDWTKGTQTGEFTVSKQ